MIEKNVLGAMYENVWMEFFLNDSFQTQCGDVQWTKSKKLNEFPLFMNSN